MSRLIELLNEQVEGAVIDNSDYTKYSDVGNLFRLMMVTNPDQPVPETSNRSLVSSMITNQDSAAVKKLQTLFNNINKFLQAGKVPTVSDKKSYFTVLFDLLLPLTKDNSLVKRSSSIAASFASGGATTLAAKRKSIVVIGKALLSNPELKLTMSDKNLIKGFMIDFEAVLDQNGEQPQNVSPETTDVVQQKLSSQSTPKVAQTVKNTREIIDAVKAKQPTTAAEIKTMLSSNKTSDVFRVDLQGDNAAINAQVNATIDKLYNKLVEQYGHEDANFATKFITDVFKNLDSAKIKRTDRSGKEIELNVLRLYWSKMKISATKNSAGDMHINVSNGMEDVDSMHPEVLRVAHIIKGYDNSGSGKMVAKTDFLQIPLSAQGAGINKRLFKDSLELYKAKGVDKMELQANIDVGGYAWFRYGFVPKDLEQIERIARWMDELIPSVVEGLKGFSKEIGDHIRKNTKTMTPEVQNTIDLLSKGKSPLAEEVLDKLFGYCSIEFQMNYDDKSKFKKMSEDVAIKNFTPVTVKRVKYSISYKALLNMNAIKDDEGLSVIPLIYQGRMNSLNWTGELDMKDLDKTYAYLNFQK